MTDLINPFGLALDEKVLTCPACERWQLHYTAEVAMQWAIHVAGPKPAGGALAWPTSIDMSRFDAMIESILREHVAQECPHPRMIHELLKGGGRLAI